MAQFESMVFYRSFYEAIEDLDDNETKLRAYQAIFKYGLDGEKPELKGTEKAIFRLIKPQIDANNIRKTNGNKGGRPSNFQNQTITKTKPNHNRNETKTKPNNNQTITETEPNVNVNANENENANENANVNVCEDAGTQTLRTGLYNNVILTKDEFDEFKRQHPDDYSDRIERLSFYMYNNGKFYHDHFATLCRWAKEDIEKQNKESKEKQKTGKQDEELPPDAFPGVETLSFGEEGT